MIDHHRLYTESVIVFSHRYSKGIDEEHYSANMLYFLLPFVGLICGLLVVRIYGSVFRKFVLTHASQVVAVLLLIKVAL